MGKLEDLRVERVDGVDRPATGHRWIMLKSEDSVEKDSAALAKTALEALVKEEGLSLSGETVEALKALAEALEVEIDFAKAEEPEAPEADADVEKDEDEDVEKDETPEADAKVTDLNDPEQFALAVNKILDARIEREVKDEMSEQATTTRLGLVTKSKQAQPEDGEPIAKGQGLFDNVIFGQ